METPDLENVVYIDEYPELKKRVWLRRLQVMRELGQYSIAGDNAELIIFPSQDV